MWRLSTILVGSINFSSVIVKQNLLKLIHVLKGNVIFSLRLSFNHFTIHPNSKCLFFLQRAAFIALWVNEVH